LATAARNQSSFIDKAFWLRVGDGLQRIVALAIFGVVHYALNMLVRLIVPSNIKGAALLLEDVFFVMFALVYGYILWDMAAAFMPFLKVSTPYPRTEETYPMTEESGE